MTLAIGILTKKTIYLAADRRVVTPDHGICEDTKIFDAHGLTFAFAGDVSVEHALRHRDFATRDEGVSVPRWWANDVAPWLADACRDREFQMLVTDGVDLFTTMDGYLRRVNDAFVAIGDGARYAYGWFDTTSFYHGFLRDTKGDILSGCLDSHMDLLFAKTAARHESVSMWHDTRVIKRKKAAK
jgi:hypothetical protein